MNHWEEASAEPEGLTPDQRAQVTTWLQEVQELFAGMTAIMHQLDPVTLSVDEFLDARGRMGTLFAKANNLSAQIAKSYGLGSAQDRIMHYLLNRVAEPVKGGALAGVSCIWEWARRTRELDVEHGWKIEVGRNEELGLGHNEYMLTTDERDEAAAKKWRTLNQIRGLEVSARERILAALVNMHPEPVSRIDLDYVAQIASRDRRKRELQEAGWRISSYEDDPSLPHGYYRLDSLEKGPPRAREYIKLRQELLHESDYTCQQCGARSELGRRVILHVHHKEFVQHGGANDRENLVVLCRPCHAGTHAVAEARVDDELLNPAADPYLSEG